MDGDPLSVLEIVHSVGYLSLLLFGAMLWMHINKCDRKETAHDENRRRLYDKLDHIEAKLGAKIDHNDAKIQAVAEDMAMLKGRVKGQ